MSYPPPPPPQGGDSIPARSTMLDVARAAGVSLKTVSRVVNHEPKVSEHTRERVEQAIRDLHFRPNAGASQLRSGRTASVGLILEDLSNPFYSSIAGAVEAVARERGYVLLTGSAEGNAERERLLAEEFIDRRVAGLLVVPAAKDHSWLAEEVEAGTLLVFIDRPAANLHTDTVLVDNEGGVALAVEHLVQRGHTRIGFVGDDIDFWTASRRLEGFRFAATAHRLEHAPTAMGPHAENGIGEVLSQWNDPVTGVTALVTGNNRVTVAILKAMRALPVRFALVGFDDFELADLIEPAVTVVTNDAEELGTRAARLLFERLDGISTVPRTEVIPSQLIVRDSSWAND